MVVKYKINNNVLKVGLHLFIWTILFLFPYLVFPRQDNDFSKLLSISWFSLFQYAIIFYFNYFILLNKLLFQKRYGFYILINLIIILFFLWFNWQFRHLFMITDLQGMIPPDDMQGGSHGGSFLHNKMPHPPEKFFIFKDLFSYLIPVIFSIAVKATENWIRMEAKKKEAEKKNMESELQHLRYQLQPHFFFNSLNNIYSLVEESPPKAQEAIHNLSKLMRYLLYDTGRDKVELLQEISFLKKYIQLMELRQPDNTRTDFIFPETLNTPYSIAPLLFIPIIENAYKHGISATQESHIFFKMSIQGKLLTFTSENTNFPKSNTDKSGSGIGLDNLRKRLELLYPDKFELKNGVKDNIYWITLQIELSLK